MADPFHIIEKLFECAKIAVRISIHYNRAGKFKKIDLRKYRGNPEKKERIKRIYAIESIKARFLIGELYFIKQTLITPSPKFEKGGPVIVGECIEPDYVPLWPKAAYKHMPVWDGSGSTF